MNYAFNEYVFYEFIMFREILDTNNFLFYKVFHRLGGLYLKQIKVELDTILSDIINISLLNILLECSRKKDIA